MWWVGGSRPKIMPLSGPSCKLRLSRSSARLRFQDRSSVAILRLSSLIGVANLLRRDAHSMFEPTGELLHGGFLQQLRFHTIAVVNFRTWLSVCMMHVVMNALCHGIVRGAGTVTTDGGMFGTPLPMMPSRFMRTSSLRTFATRWPKKSPR